MDYLTELGGLAMGSRLKRLSERLSQEVGAIYKESNVEFEPRWFPVFRLLGSRGEASIVDIANAIEVTHPAVNQIAAELLDAGLIVQLQDKNDKRRRLLSLSKKGKKIYDELQHTWRLLSMSIGQTLEDSESDLLKAIRSFEDALDRAGLAARVEHNRRVLESEKVAIVEFEPAYRKHFARLNEAWITKFFALEAADIKTLENPEQIIADGGVVLFARFDGRIIGTCALLNKGERVFELAKMAVDEAYQGLGAGRLLLNACIEKARAKGARQVTLETNTKLAAAVNMYRSAGFQPASIEEIAKSKYARVDLVMALDLVPGSHSASSGNDSIVTSYS